VFTEVVKYIVTKHIILDKVSEPGQYGDGSRVPQVFKTESGTLNHSLSFHRIAAAAA
jgi:hypothetical protein